VVDGHAIARYLPSVLQQKAAGEVLQMHHGWIGRVGELQDCEWADRRRVNWGVEWQYLKPHIEVFSAK
jgi:hypothetical protein